MDLTRSWRPNRWQYRHTVLALCTLAFFVVMFGRLAISPVVSAITATFAVSNALIGAILSGMWLAYGLSQFPSGLLADRYGERMLIGLALVGTAGATVVIAFAPTVWVFAVAVVALGVVAGFHYSPGTTLLARTHEDLGRAIGIHNAGATVAGLLAPVAVTWLWLMYDWRIAIASTAAIGVPAAILLFTMVRSHPPQHPETDPLDRIDLGVISALLQRPVIGLLLVVAISAEFAWQGVASFLPVFLIEYRDMTPATAATGFSVYFAAQGVAQIVVGSLADRLGPERATAGSLLIGSLGFGALLWGETLVLGIIGLLGIGVGMSFEAALLPRVMQALATDERGVGFGLVRTVYLVVGSAGSVAVGTTADLAGWGVAFGGLGVFLAIGAGLVVVARGLEWHTK